MTLNSGIHPLRLGLASLAFLTLLAPTIQAQTIPNASFESNTFTVFPGYVSSNTTITGWTASPANRVGLNPSGGSPFADNGAIPNGTKVAFVQSTGSGSTLATTITGLTPGAPYRVSFRANSRSQVVAPNPNWSLNGGEFAPFTASPIVGGSNPYYTNTVLFTATGPTASLIISNQTAGDSTVLVDDFSISSLATMVVSNTANSGPGSLRDTIAAAPTGAIIGFVPALSGGTITLTSEIILGNNVAIDAGSLPAGITITGGNATRLFFVNLGRTVSLRGLTLTGGNGSGATAPGYGGAIQNQGNLWLTQCTLFSNSVPQAGGAIYNHAAGNLTLMQCTFSGNFGNFGGGAIFNEGPSLSLTNCTFASNRIQFVGGGAVLSTGSTVAMGACLFSGNFPNFNSGPDFFLQSGAITAANCLLSNGANSGVANNVDGNIVGTAGSPINALLSPLGNYGGSTPTLLPMPGSPAIDKGLVVAGLANDQRGFPRLRDVAPDIGAVEFNNPVVTISANSGAGSLRQVVSNSLIADYITFAPALSGASLFLSSEIVLSNGVTIDASSLPAGLTIHGSNATRIFSVASGQTAFLSDLKFTGGNGVGAADNNFGGAIQSRGTLTLTRCTLLGNSSGNSGGAIANIGSVLTLMNCTLSENVSLTFGGAIHNTGTLMLTNCTLSGDSAPAGGGIFSQGGSLALTHCTVAGNYASGFGGGGGIYVPSSGSLIANNTIIAGNAAAQGAGPDARIESSPVLTITRCLIGNALDSGITAINGNLINVDARLAPLANNGGPTRTQLPLPGSPAIDAGTNSATTDQRGFLRPVDGDNNGSAVADIGAAEVVQLVVSNTNNSGNGSLRQTILNAPVGAMVAFAPALSGSTITLTNEIVLSNNLTIAATALPAGITVSGGNTTRILSVPGGRNVLLSDLTLTAGNGAGQTLNGGGGAILNFGGTLTLNRCTLVANSTFEGGGIGNYVGANLTLNQCTVTGNSASGDSGGGILNDNSALTVNHSTIVGNSASGTFNGGGGGIASVGGGLFLSNSIVAVNSAPLNPNIALNLTVFTGANNITNGNPLLASLGNYGGPTRTMPPLAGSPAIDAATNGPIFLTDQRGFPRPVGIAADIGSVEGTVTLITATNPPVLRGLVRLANGTFQFSFTNLTGAGFTVFATTNVALPFNQWSTLGPALESPAGSGQFQFSDPQAANNPRRYYRVKSP